MEDKKQQAIVKAYGEYWEKVKNNLTDLNWFKSKEVLGDFANTTIRRDFPNVEWECMDNFHPVYCFYFRPKSLSGIESNNGWIKVDNNTNLLLSLSDNYVFTDKNNMYTYERYSAFMSISETENITHYQPIKKPQPPIF